MRNPPLSPDESRLRRVLLIAGLDGIALIVLSGLGSLLALLLTDFVGLFVTLIMLGAGIWEWSGRKQLKRGNADGMRRLIRAQMIVLNLILIYCARMVLSFDIETTMALLTPYTATINEALGTDIGPLLPAIKENLATGVYVVYGLLAFLTLICQGGLALYYRSRRTAVERAISARLKALAIPPRLTADPEDWVT